MPSLRGMQLGVPTIDAGISVEYLLRDEFLTDQAPTISSPRTAEPGPGQLFVQDHSSGRWQIADGMIELTASSTSTIPILSTPSTFARVAGKALKHRTAQIANGPGPNQAFSPSFGWTSHQNSPSAINTLAMSFATGQYWFIEQNVNTLSGIDNLVSPNQFAEYAHVMRSSGTFHIINNKLAFIGIIGNAAMYPFVGQGASNRHTPQTDYMRVSQLGGPWLDDYGIATTRLAGERSAGDLFTHEAGAFWLEFTITTLPASGEITINFRRQDNNNCWRLTISSTGSVQLIEVVAGTPTARSTLTFCQANDRIMCAMDGAVERLLRWRPGGTGSANTSLYSSVATFTTQTQGEIISLGTGGAISDLITWPRTLSGEALEWLEAM